jgi:hypothetical protein
MLFPPGALAPRSGSRCRVPMQFRLPAFFTFFSLFLIVALTGCGSGTPPTLAITLSNSALTVFPDNTSTKTLQLSITATGVKTPATVTLSGLPSGVTITPAKLTLSPGTSGIFTFLAATTAGEAAITAAGGAVLGSNPSVTLPVTIQASNGVVQASANLSLTISGTNADFVPTSTDLPVLQITTAAGAAIASTDTYVTGTVSITPGTANTKDVAYSGPMEIKGHGHTTWAMPKKPYKIKLDSKSALLGMPTQKNWVLLANYDDKSLLRNAAALYAGTFTKLAWSPHSRFVELYLNGEYEGNYQLTEQVEIDKNRLNITEMDDTDVSGEAVTGGYLLEFDTQDQPDDILFPISGVIFDLTDPDPAEPAQLNYIQNYLQQASDALYSEKFADPNTGYAPYLNTTTFIDWYLVEELFKNNDAIDWSSCYIYKDMNGKLNMGPLWDFDVAAGNVNYNGNDSPTGWWLRSNPVPIRQWTERLFEDPAFAAAVTARWNQLKPQFQTLPAWINLNAAALQQSQENNFQRWPILGQYVWPNSEVAGSYQGEATFLNSWLTTRIAWLDGQFNATTAASEQKQGLR